MGKIRFVTVVSLGLLGLAAPAVADEPVEPAQAFANRESVSYSEFVAALRQVADELSASESVKAAHRALLSEHELSEEELPLESFSRIRLVFEATRDGGLWDLQWDVTDQMPWSDKIWGQWNALGDELESKTLALDGAGPSAIAECDELSALFSILARDMGTVGFVGLHWPVWNHVVAVWQVPRSNGDMVRIVVPTSQIFLSSEATLGTKDIDTQRVVFPYKRHDLKDKSELPGSVARFLIRRARLLGTLSTEQLSKRRARLGTS